MGLPCRRLDRSLTPYTIGDVRIQLNGEPREFERPMSIAELLDHLAIDGRTVAVEYNRLVVRRSRYATTMIEENAEVEIVNFVGGGGASR
jgi:thiamine biosynthesis protein ThiS